MDSYINIEEALRSFDDKTVEIAYQMVTQYDRDGLPDRYAQSIKDYAEEIGANWKEAEVIARMGFTGEDLSDVLSTRERASHVWYSTRNEAVERGVVPALGEFVDDFDLDLLSTRAVFHARWSSNGYYVIEDEEEFWEIVQECDKSDR